MSDTILVDVLAIGENSVDTVYRLPVWPQPDTATAKLPVLERRISPGGQAATTVCACAALGLRTRYLGAFGGDDHGRFVREALARRGVDVRHAVTRAVPNRYAVILLAAGSGERVVLWGRDPGSALDEAEVDPALVTAARLVHVDGTDPAAAIRAATLARAAGLPVTSDIDDVGGATAALVAAVTMPIFSEHALEAFTGEADPARALRALRRTHDGILGVTRGARGAMLLDGDHLHVVSGVAIQAADTTGAGDVFRGAFIYALLRGDPPARMLAFANAAAAASCRRTGAIDAVPGLSEIEALLERGRQ